MGTVRSLPAVSLQASGNVLSITSQLQARDSGPNGPYLESFITVSDIDRTCSYRSCLAVIPTTLWQNSPWSEVQIFAPFPQRPQNHNAWSCFKQRNPWIDSRCSFRGSCVWGIHMQLWGPQQLVFPARSVCVCVRACVCGSHVFLNVQTYPELLYQVRAGDLKLRYGGFHRWVPQKW